MALKLLTFFFHLRLDEAQSEAMKLKVENGKLLRKVDSIKNENQNITWIEQEKDSLKQTVAQMKATIDNLQKTQAKQVLFFTSFLCSSLLNYLHIFSS